MILNSYGKGYEHDGVEYMIGEPVIGVKGSKYEGLTGKLMEIRDGNDKKMKGSSPEFYCVFCEPALNAHQNNSANKAYPDLVAVSPQMITNHEKMHKMNMSVKVYVLTEKWSDNEESGETSEIYLNEEDAQNGFELWLQVEKDTCFLYDNPSDREIVEELSGNQYKRFVKCRDEERHYELKLEAKEIYLSDKFAKHIAGKVNSSKEGK